MSAFERPQYITGKGLKRTNKNPTKKKGGVAAQPPSKKGQFKKNYLLKKSILSNKRKGLSKEAAKIIANAIKGMLNE